MDISKPEIDSDSRTRASAVRHAKGIEGKKKLQRRVTDLIVEAFDLPSNPKADPAQPSLPDVQIFKQCLRLFQPSDLKDLIYERNVDNRCGYALCPRPNIKVLHGGHKVWNKKSGSEFKLVDKAEMEKWCSKACEERNDFAQSQLSTEPAWLRDTQQYRNIRLLDEVRKDGDLNAAFKDLSVNSGSSDELAEKLLALSMERGDPPSENAIQSISVIEKASKRASSPPSQTTGEQIIEGYHLKQAPGSGE